MLTATNALEVVDNACWKPMIDLLQGQERDLIITLKGSPIARITPYPRSERPILGIAKGKLSCPEDIDFCNAEIDELFFGGES
ncbi:MAG: hypothetical protein IJ849_12570 [Selenomonadaceae bacterium]|nr:hypothetical protein [Selenomonadaceae bacterium]